MPSRRPEEIQLPGMLDAEAKANGVTDEGPRC